MSDDSIIATVGGYPVAAINELRYAGHHVLEASQADDEAEVEDHIASARNHCRRAVNDAVV